MQREQDYGNSRPLDLHRTSTHPEVDRCIAALLPQLYIRVPKSEGREAALLHLKTLVMDLYAAHSIDAARWLGHSRDPKWYRAVPRRYNGLRLSGERIVSLIERLRENELIEFKPGFRAVGAEGHLDRVNHIVVDDLVERPEAPLVPARDGLFLFRIR